MVFYTIVKSPSLPTLHYILKQTILLVNSACCEMGSWGAQHLIDFIQICKYNLRVALNVRLKDGKMDNMWLVLHWGSPIGTGIFLVCLGAMIYLISKADEKSKHAKAFAKEKGLEKKKE